MYKVKNFTSSAAYALEIEMNKWLEENRNIKIITVKQSSGMNKYDSLHTVITIFYKPMFRKQDMEPG